MPITCLFLSLVSGLAILVASSQKYMTCPSILSTKRSLTIATLGSSLICSEGLGALILLLLTTVETLACSLILTEKRWFLNISSRHNWINMVNNYFFFNTNRFLNLFFNRGMIFKPLLLREINMSSKCFTKGSY